MKNIFYILTILVFSINAKANEQFEYLESSINTFGIIQSATKDLKKELNDSSKLEDNEKSIMKFVSHLFTAANNFNPYTKSENKSIQKTATDLKSLSEDLVKESYGFISKSKADGKLDKEDFLNKIDFVTSFYGHISMGICTGLVRERPEKYKDRKDLQFINLTKEESKSIKKQLNTTFGKTIKKEQNAPTEISSIEIATRIIYSFLELDWQYLKK